MVKHYYDEDGHPEYPGVKKELLVKLASAVIMMPNSEPDFKQFRMELRHNLTNRAAGIIQGYEIHSTMAGCGGCLTLAQWREQEDFNPIEQAVKEIMFDFVDQGFLYREFLLVINDAICQLLFACYNFDED